MLVDVSIKLSNTIDKVYTYKVNDNELTKIKVGTLVIVNVQTQLKVGIVVKLNVKPVKDFKINEIIAIYDQMPLNKYQKQVASVIAEHSMASLYAIINLFTKEITKLKINIEFYDRGKLVADYNSADHKQKLLASNYERKCIVTESKKAAKYKYVKVSGFDITKLSPKQLQVYNYIANYSSVSVSKVVREVGISRGVINTLEKKRLVAIVQKTKQFETVFTADVQTNNKLSPLQKQAYESLEEGLNLLHGTCGSGKTEIYVEIIKRQLQMNKQTLVIVPSVALAIQVVGKMQVMFEQNVIIYHNKLTASEKISYQKQIRNDEVKIVVATFNGLFLPFANLSYVIFDEAHSQSYRLANPYNVSKNDLIDGLVKNKINVLLASASPAIIDFAKTMYGNLNLVTLQSRYHNTPLPDVKFIKPQSKPINSKLIELITINKKRKKPTLIFFNKSGYAKQVLCNDCLNIMLCPNCTKPLTYIQNKNQLVCKYDGYSSGFKHRCQKCNSPNLQYLGIGIEQFYELLLKEFPTLNIKYLSSNNKSNEIYDILNDYRDNKIDVLVGTQIISYGIDFLNVEHIYVCNIDNLLTLNEISNHENTYNILTQVIGRVGRTSMFSNAYIETNFEHHFVMKSISAHDYYNYFQTEINYRKLTNDPPFYRICKIEVFSPNVNKLQYITNELRAKLKLESLIVSELLTPYIDYRYNKHRRYFIIKYRKINIKKILSNNIDVLSENNIEYIVDLNNYQIGV